MSLRRGTAPPRGTRGLLPCRTVPCPASRAWPGVAGLLRVQGTRLRRLPLPLSLGRQQLPRRGADCVSVGQWVICLRPGQRAALTCSHHHRYWGIEARAQPHGSVSVVRRVAPLRTAELLGHNSRDATKKPVLTPCPEPLPSSPIPKRSSRSLAACEAPGKGGARRRYRARVGSWRAEGGVSSLGMGKAGRDGGQTAQPCRSPALDPTRALCLLPTSPCASPDRVGLDGSPEVGATGSFSWLLAQGGSEV